MKRTFAILGVGFVAGAVAFAIWHKKQRVDTSTTSNSENENAGSEIINKSSVNDADLAKHSAASIMTDRHEEAAQIMKEAVDIICRNSEVSEDAGKELEQISAELDELLSEE